MNKKDRKNKEHIKLITNPLFIIKYVLNGLINYFWISRSLFKFYVTIIFCIKHWYNIF